MIVELRQLLNAVEAAFTVTGQGLTSWPDPHPDRAPLEEEYSRLLDPAKWRIIGARADAWIAALVDSGIAVVERDAVVQWQQLEAGPVLSRSDRLVPFGAGALPLVLSRSRIADVADAGVVVGVGDPASRVAWYPHCGCDACDSGSQDELDRLDHDIVGIVTGAFRRLSDGVRTLDAFGDHDWRSVGRFDRHEVAAVLADPSGWHEVRGTSWFGASPR